ncbi:CD209 antigen-like protein E [Clarias gariepinus]|uniref:CD209 antigen-like protein E n=1 Tax=Clarias gariepinus TaxID=13013 RepID=UPI00234D3838|nr:CD209 antigen-like protein E [Clarias gariepinus]
MSEPVSDYVNYTKKKGKCIERVAEIYNNADAIRAQELKEEPYVTDIKKTLQTKHTGDTAWSRCYRLSAVCVALLCVLLLAAVIVLWLKFNSLKTEKDQLQVSYNSMRNEQQKLQQETSLLQNVLLKLGCRVFNSNVYYNLTKKMYWDESRNECKARGADLVIINSTEEQEFISTYYGDTEAWIGLTDRDTEGTFKWVDGSSLTTAFWWNGEPNSWVGDSEDCVITGFKKAKSNMSTWADYPCDFPVVGICEMNIFN